MFSNEILSILKKVNNIFSKNDLEEFQAIRIPLAVLLGERKNKRIDKITKTKSIMRQLLFFICLVLKKKIV